MMVCSTNSSFRSQYLADLVTLLDDSLSIEEIKNIDITDITDDSRSVVSGSLFIARSGHESHGERFISDAIKNGAVAILRQIESNVSVKTGSSINWISTAINNSIPEINILFSNKEISKLALVFYHDPSKQVQVTAITGTNGKTSCAYILANLINQNQKCGFIGTIGQGDISALTETNNTTLGVIENQKIIASMLGKSTKQLVMEVSSHALSQHRIDGIDINCAVFTNLTHDHLDYHQTFEQYGEAKLELFRLASVQHAIINLDDVFSEKILKVISDKVKVTTFAIDNSKADLVAEIIEFKLNSSLVQIKTKNETIKVNVPLLGKFNISNLLAVCAVLLSQGQTLTSVATLIPDIQPVRGRMQCLGGVNELPLVVVDYAHTPDAIQNVLQTLDQHSIGKLWCVFGCGGDRDTTKRASMGEIVASLADTIVITNDNPRSEDPKTIVNEIVSGINDSNITNVILDRREAIQFAIKNANKFDVILIAGKGHESYQIIDNIKYHFDDVKVSLEALNGVGMK